MDDVISRNALFREMEKAQWYNNADRDEIAEELVLNAPTIEPQRKKGHWIRHPEQRNIFNGKTIECSECHEKYTVQYVEDEWFCRHCGADMRGDGAECQNT